LIEKKQIEIDQNEDGQTQIQIRLEKDTIWLSQAQMAERFDKNSDTVGLHLRNIYKSGELEKTATTGESPAVRQEGKRQVRWGKELFLDHHTKTAPSVISLI